MRFLCTRQAVMLGLVWFCCQLFGASSASAFVPLRIFGDIDPYRRSPFLKWKTIETSHFRVHFSEALTETGTKVAHLMEEAYSVLSPFLEWQPSAFIDVTVLDNSDEANGLAAPVARFGILLWVSPPESYRSNNFHDDWLWTLILHELTHYIQIDTTHGIYNFLRVLTGDLLLPNVSWPRWMHEGFAVFMETFLTKGGRGRSSYYEMVLRTAWIEGTFDQQFSLDRLAGFQPFYPGGDWPYQLGFHLFRALAGSDPKKLTRLSHEGASGVPILIDAQLKAVEGKNWSHLWDILRAESKARAVSAQEALAKEPLSEIQFLTKPRADRARVVQAKAVQGPLIAYHASSTEARGGLWLYDSRIEAHRWLNDKLGGGSLVFTPEGRWVLSSQLRRTSPFNGLMHDLQAIQTETGRRVWLTEGARARDPFLFQGQNIVFTQYQGADRGSTALALGHFEEESDQAPKITNLRVLWSPGNHDRISNPVVRGDFIYFSWHKDGAFEEVIARVPLSGGAHPEVLVQNGAFNRFPLFHPSGKLCFISNVTGIDNLHCQKKGKAGSERKTHVYSGLEFPAFDAEGRLLASVYTSVGWQLARVSMQSFKTRTLASPGPIPDSPVKPPKELPPLEVRPYAAFRSLAPRFWLPSVGWDARGVLLGAQLEGWDTLDFFRYSIGAAWHTSMGFSGGMLECTSRRLGPTVSFNMHQETSLLVSKEERAWLKDAGLPGEEAFTVSRDLGARVHIPFAWTYAQLSLIPSLQFVQMQFRHSQRPMALLEQTVGLGSLGLVFSDLVYSDLGVAPEGGRWATVGVLTGVSQDPRATPFASTVYGGIRQFFEPFEHVSLQAYLRTSLTPQATRHFRFIHASLQGRSSLLPWLGSLSGNGAQAIGMRGFPNQLYFGRWIGLTGLELAFPIWNVYRGIAGSLPILAKRLSAMTFLESAYVEQVSQSRLLASTGGAIKLECELFSFPVSMSGHVHYGFLPRDRQGAWDVWFSIEANGLNF